MASAEHEPITGVWGQSPQRGPGQSPWSGGKGAKPPEAESILVIGCPTEPANLAPVRENSMLRSTGVRVGGQSAWCPQPRHWGACAPLRLRRLWLSNCYLQLHSFALSMTCRTSSLCTVEWRLARFQLTRRIARSLGDSWASCQN